MICPLLSAVADYQTIAQRLFAPLQFMGKELTS
jgi:hypothetical protein